MGKVPAGRATGVKIKKIPGVAWLGILSLSSVWLLQTC